MNEVSGEQLTWMIVDRPSPRHSDVCEETPSAGLTPSAAEAVAVCIVTHLTCLQYGGRDLKLTSAHISVLGHVCGEIAREEMCRA